MGVKMKFKRRKKIPLSKKKTKKKPQNIFKPNFAQNTYGSRMFFFKSIQIDLVAYKVSNTKIKILNLKKET